MGNGSDGLSGVAQRADAVVARLQAPPAASQKGDYQAEWSALLDAVRALDARYAFDRDGRPSAIQAVRHALPSMERDLFDAIVEDHACEVAALEEAVRQLALAVARHRA